MKMGMFSPVVEYPILSRALRSMCNPARRHKCAICKLIFECHLCTIGNDHDIHAYNTAATICEFCIEQHELWVVAMNAGPSDRAQQGERPHRTSASLEFGELNHFFDHVTGESIGWGTIRRTGYRWGASFVWYGEERLCGK